MEESNADLSKGSRLLVVVNYYEWTTGSIMHDEIRGHMTKETFTDQDVVIIELNNSVINILHCSIGKDQFYRASGYSSAKEIWDLLAPIHEGMTKDKKIKLTTLKRRYELFGMKRRESMRDMFDILVNIEAKEDRSKLRAISNESGSDIEESKVEVLANNDQHKGCSVYKKSNSKNENFSPWRAKGK
ncbi:uncharacterized protein LOC132613087 [Lycium barbarum]|uniref:uncharacterized protein LOC132613087 n=1 Tax=Lycium barbarum TaxID=112863 RepID=UPI00293E2A1A|nr:uncharacterized protein LOC132613087 [Lycium barbarum]